MSRCKACKDREAEEARYLKGLLPPSYIRARIRDLGEALEEMGTKGTGKATKRVGEVFYSNSGLIFRALQLYAAKTEAKIQKEEKCKSSQKK